ncbi:MAG: IniB N-terminal domain-containing protein, partial [Umezawaea sp.]
MSLLQFILQLLGDDSARAEFTASPHEVLRENGFDNLCAADVRDARPLIVDNVQTAQSNSFDRELNGGGNSTHVHHTPPPPSDGGGGHGGGGDGGMDGAIQEIHYITQNYSWSDSHNTVLDNSVNQNIWADGDVVQWFDNDPVVASGDGAVAAGDDVNG